MWTHLKGTHTIAHKKTWAAGIQIRFVNDETGRHCQIFFSREWKDLIHHDWSYFWSKSFTNDEETIKNIQAKKQKEFVDWLEKGMTEQQQNNAMDQSGLTQEEEEINKLGIQERTVKVPEVGSGGPPRHTRFESTYLYPIEFYPIEELYRIDPELADKCGCGEPQDLKSINAAMQHWRSQW